MLEEEEVSKIVKELLIEEKKIEEKVEEKKKEILAENELKLITFADLKPQN